MTKVPESKLTLELFQYTLLWGGYDLFDFPNLSIHILFQSTIFNLNQHF